MTDQAPSGPYRVAVDIGGTFTDCVAVGADGSIHTGKAPTTPEDQSQGVIDSIAVTAAEAGVPFDALLANTSDLVHGCTLATNAILERKGVRTGLITTKGFGETLSIGRVLQKTAGLSEQEISHTSRLHKAEPPIVNSLDIAEVTERIDRDGKVVVDLDESDARAALELLLRQGVEAIAICFLWSFMTPRHEEQVATMLRKLDPDVYVSVSSELVPLLGEYERMVTAVFNSYVGPPTARYLNRLENRLRDRGYKGSLFVMQSTGGSTTVTDACRRSIVTIDSGPVGGTLGAKHLGESLGEDNIVCTDVGGTSFDVSIISAGDLELEHEPVMQQYTFRTPKVAVQSIGAGGGSIVWVDAGGFLRVGPASAGSVPGPVCYGQGGTEPTVTDANVVLGYLNPEFFLGGRLSLDQAAARSALSSVGSVVGMDAVEVAYGVFNIANAQMADLIRRCLVGRGHDPREFTLVAYGGAGPTHACFYGPEAGVKRIVVPATAAVFSAYGMVTADISRVYEKGVSLKTPLGPESQRLLTSTFRELMEKAVAEFAGEGFATQLTTRAYVHARFERQAYDLAVEVPAMGQGIEPGFDDSTLKKLFIRRYARLYGEETVVSGSEIEVTSIRVEVGYKPSGTAYGSVGFNKDGARARHRPRGGPREERPVYWDDAGFTPTPIYADDATYPGDRFEGPCIVERPTDTVLIPASLVGDVDALGNIEIREATR